MLFRSHRQPQRNDQRRNHPNTTPPLRKKTRRSHHQKTPQHRFHPRHRQRRPQKRNHHHPKHHARTKIHRSLHEQIRLRSNRSNTILKTKTNQPIPTICPPKKAKNSTKIPPKNPLKILSRSISLCARRKGGTRYPPQSAAHYHTQ